MPSSDSTPIDWDDPDIEPHEAFALLSDANRFDIIRVFAEAPQDSLSFNELYGRSKFSDSGQFNYHLKQLTGPFIRKTEDGYRLRHAAEITYRLAVSGWLSDRGEAQITTVDTNCPQCGCEKLTAAYEGDRFWIRCEDCGRRATVGPFPPQALRNHDADRVAAVFDRYTMGLVVRAGENVCPWCASPLTASLEHEEPGWPTVEWVIRRCCSHCRGWIHTRLYDLVRLHPAVIAFYYEHGVDIFGSSFWEVESILTDRVTVTTDTDEWVAVVTLAYDGDEIELGLDEGLQVSTISVLGVETT
jgi:hypothetical protein